MMKKKKISSVFLIKLTSVLLIFVLALSSFTLAHTERDSSHRKIDAEAAAALMPTMRVTEITNLEAGVRHYLFNAYGEKDFIFYIAADAEYADSFINSIISTFSNLGIETMADVLEAREALMELNVTHEHVNTTYELHDDGAMSFPPPSMWISDLPVFFWNRNINFQPPSHWFYNFVLEGRNFRYIYSGHLSLQGFSAFRTPHNPNLWDFVASYQGTIFLSQSIPVLPPQLRLPDDTVESVTDAATEPILDEQLYCYEYRKQRLINMQAAHYAYLQMYRYGNLTTIPSHSVYEEALAQSSIFVPEFRTFVQNQNQSFRPPQHLFYSRQVGGRLYQGNLSIVAFTMTPRSNGLWDVLATYSGWIFSGTGGVLPEPWGQCVYEECEYDYY